MYVSHLFFLIMQLIAHLDTNQKTTAVSFRRGYHPDSDKIPRSQGSDAISISAFSLSTMQDSIARREAIKQMWDSGTEYIVLVDHDTKEGFLAIAEAREYLLKCGRKEVEAKEQGEIWEDDSRRGCYVVAPVSSSIVIHQSLLLIPKRPVSTRSRMSNPRGTYVVESRDARTEVHVLSETSAP